MQGSFAENVRLRLAAQDVLHPVDRGAEYFKGVFSSETLQASSKNRSTRSVPAS
jgi:hypothetical protein